MHAAAINLRGGVSPRGIRLRGQSIIEYVLIIAVIGLVIVFAGPGVAGAIRNQFNLVGNTVNSGANGGTEGGGASGGGSAGADSATVQAAVSKDAKDWTLDEQKTVAEGIAAKGEASPAYAKAKAAMDAGTEWSVKLTNCHSMTYIIIGINHDDLADGSGKDCLTFEATGSVSYSAINSSDKTLGGWEKSELRAKMNSGEIWNLMPSELQSKLEPVRKLTDNQGGGADPKTPTVTVDKLFLISATEVWESSWTEHWNSFSHNGADVNPKELNMSTIETRALRCKTRPRRRSGLAVGHVQSTHIAMAILCTSTLPVTTTASGRPARNGPIRYFASRFLSKPAQSCAGFSFVDI